ncbi:hypothetical protein [Neisseria sp.]
MGGCRGAVGIGTALQRLIRPSEKTKPEHFACSGFVFSDGLLQSKTCFKFKLRHPDNETFADAVFKFISAFDAAPRRADLRTAVLFYFNPDNSGVPALFLQRVETLKTHHAIQ